MDFSDKPKTGDIFDLIDVSRQVIVESVTNILDNEYAVVYPLSYSIAMACNEDFIFYMDVPFMAEGWNSLLIPIPTLKFYKGSLDSKYVTYFSSYISAKYNKSIKKSGGMDAMVGPPIKSSADIRYIFQLQEKETFSPVRNSHSHIKR